MSRLILGLGTGHTDSSAALVDEKGIVAAIAEERINRIKHAAGFPGEAIKECLRIAGAKGADITDIAVARNPWSNLWFKARFVLANPGIGIPRVINRFKLHQAVGQSPMTVAQALGLGEGELKAKFHQVEHHVAHCASAFYQSGFERATGITVDGAGDFVSTMVARCEGNTITPLWKEAWPNSLGAFYTGLCQFIGFDRFGEEFKVMGLQAYGDRQRYREQMRQLVTFDPVAGRLRLNFDYYQNNKFRAEEALGMLHAGGEIIPGRIYGDRMAELFGPPRTDRKSPITQREKDIAASMQAHFEEIYLALIDFGVKKVGIRDVAMAGGVVLNAVGNGRAICEGHVDRAYYHPACADDGTAAGAALYVMHGVYNAPRTPKNENAYFGPSWTDEQIEPAVKNSGFRYRKLTREELLETTASALATGKIVGWFQGREEWGPRALGNRSILCHPGWPNMKAILNARIKNREPFRPFAPAVLAERCGEIFEGDHEVPFMVVVYYVRPEWRDRLSAITHDDGTGRVQTVNRANNALYYDLIQRFEGKTGVPVILNTSFNENEPVVHRPEEAVACFARTKMDVLAIGSYFLEKPEGHASELETAGVGAAGA